MNIRANRRHLLAFNVFLLGALVGSAVFYALQPKSMYTTPLFAKGIEVRDQSVLARITKPFAYRQVGAIEDVGRPEIIKSIGQFAFVLDLSDRTVKKFDSAGKRVAVYGAHFKNPTDFTVDAEGGVWVTDPVSYAVTKFSQDGSKQHGYEVQYSLARITAADTSTLVGALGTAEPRLFMTYQFGDMRPVNQGGEIAADQVSNGLAVMGVVSGDGGGRFAYASYYGGVLGLFDNHAQRLYLRRMVPRRSLPAIETTPQGLKRIVNSDNLESTLWVGFVDKFIVLFIRMSGYKPGGLLDYYSATDGEYQFSMQLPPDVKYASVADTRLYIIHSSGSISVWDRGPKVQ